MIDDSELAQHALRIKNLLDLFWGRALPGWAIDALATYTAQLHVAAFGRPLPHDGAAPPARRNAKILQFPNRRC